MGGVTMESTMQVRTPKILSFEKVRDVKPDSGSGTGYNQYVVIRIKYDSMMPTEAYISNWYASKESQLAELNTHLGLLARNYCYVSLTPSNIEDFFNCLKS